MQHSARKIVCDEWHNAVKEFGLSPGSQIETVIGRIINRIDEGPGTRPGRALAWAAEMFGAVALRKGDRALRFIEEAIELVHALGVSRTVLAKVIGRVYAAPAGSVPREIGQAQICLETLAEHCGVSADDEAGKEFERVQSIPKAEWDRRHAAKVELGIATA